MYQGTFCRVAGHPSVAKPLARSHLLLPAFDTIKTIGFKDLWLSLRSDMVYSGSYPVKIDMIRKNLAASRNVFAEDNEERADWVEDMRDAPDDGLVKDHAEVVYFTGCVAA